MGNKLVISSFNECKLKSLSTRQQEQLKSVIMDRLLMHRRGINHYKGVHITKKLKNIAEYYTSLAHSSNKSLSEYGEEVLCNKTNFVLDRLVDIVNKHGSVSLALDLASFASSFNGTQYRIAYGICLDLATEIELFLDSLSTGCISRAIKRAKSRRERVYSISADLNVAFSDKQSVDTD